MTELAAIFDELGLTQYLDSFLDQGFDTWDTILDITEPDLYVCCAAQILASLTAELTGLDANFFRSDVLGVKLGHRRVRETPSPRDLRLPC